MRRWKPPSTHNKTPAAHLQVTVKNAHVVHGLDPFEHLLGEALVVHLRQRLLALDDLVQVAVHQLHHHVQLRLGFVDAQVVQRDHVGVVPEHLHQPYLAQRVPCVPIVVGKRPDALDRNLAMLQRVDRRRHHAVRPPPQDLGVRQVVPIVVNRERVARHHGCTEPAVCGSRRRRRRSRHQRIESVEEVKVRCRVHARAVACGATLTKYVYLVFRAPTSPSMQHLTPPSTASNV